MGWDADATYRGEVLSRRYPKRATPAGVAIVGLPGAGVAFKAASRRVAKQHGAADAHLGFGGLDCSSCGRALEAATGQSTAAGAKWSPKDVRRLAKSAKWPEPLDWDSACAREFLNLCARFGLGVEFSN